MFTVLTNLALGVISTLAAQMIAIAGLPAGSLIIPGHLMFDNTNNTNIEYVGLQQTVKHTAAGYDFLTNGSETGFTLKANGVTQLQTYTTPCSATGGMANYAFCYVPSPFTATGTLTQVSLDCAGTALASIVASGAIVKQTNKTVATTVANIPNFTNKTYGSGSHVAFLTGSTLVNPRDAIRIQEARTSIPTTTNINCNVRTSWYLPKGL